MAWVLHKTNSIFTGIFYVLYPLLLLGLFCAESDSLIKTLMIPSAGFLLVSGLRLLVNRPRPYERFGLSPVIQKDTKGRSFPSRHVFSAAIIAAAFFVQQEPWLIGTGAALFVCALVLGALRVIAGVHYVSDVAAALVCAGIGLATFYIWP